jgi:hypothetical protein
VFQIRAGVVDQLERRSRGARVASSAASIASSMSACATSFDAGPAVGTARLAL